jgi:cytosine/uracil/thiamine/allantoin permease
MAAGMAVALVGFFVPQVEFLYSLSWFTGFTISFILYYILMRKHVQR